MMLFMKRNEGKDRRKYPRINTRNLLAVYLPERFVFNLVNLSENGLQFTASLNLEKSALLNVDVNLAEAGLRISGLSRVVWVREFSRENGGIYRVGVTFIDLSEQALQAIRRFMMPALKAA